MVDFFGLGPSPVEAGCVQVLSGQPETYIESCREVHNYVNLLRKLFVNIIDADRIYSKKFDHDFGPYNEAVVSFETDNEDQVKRALFIESHTPAHWIHDEDIVPYTENQFNEWVKAKYEPFKEATL
jgi:hypothetical protein